LEKSTFKRIRIKRITIEKNEDVYDLKIKDNHNFFANGLLVHNCGEISLRPFQFCNVVEINASDIETQEELENRIKAAAFIGTLQATYTDFHYLRDIWQTTTEKDALLGIGMTGIASGRVQKLDIESAVRKALYQNTRLANKIGINKAARLTTIKPAGSSSIVLGTSSGIHPWHSQYYIRRIRVGKNEAIYKYLSKNHPELLEDDKFRSHDRSIISIPQKAPEGAITREETAIELLERAKDIHLRWIRPGHRSGSNYNNVSITVSVKDDEWEDIKKWMWKNREYYNGITVLPYDGGTYIQAPFEECSKEYYEEYYNKLKKINTKEIIEFQDSTNLSGEVACGGGMSCEII